MEQARTNNESIVGFFRANYRLRRLNTLAGNEIAKKFGAYTRRQFELDVVDRIPVLIAARNEEEDLPKLLVALSYSSLPVEPIVIDNNSSDNTYDFAKRMGALVLQEDHIGQVCALRRGFCFLADSHPDLSFALITDADSFPIESWAGAARRRLSLFSQERGGIITGPRYKVGRRRFEPLFTIARHLADLKFYAQRGKIKAYGPNLGIRLDSQGRIGSALSDLDPKCILGTDNYIFSTVVSAGGDSGYLTDARGVVLDKDDRCPAWRDLLLRILKKRSVESYYEDRLLHGVPGAYSFLRDGSTKILLTDNPS